MPGFWEYFSSSVEQANSKQKELYDRQMNLTQMLGNSAQQQTSNLLSMAGIRNNTLGSLADIENSRLDRILRKDEMAQDLNIASMNDKTQRYSIDKQAAISAADNRARLELAELENKFRTGELDHADYLDRQKEIRNKAETTRLQLEAQFEATAPGPRKWTDVFSGRNENQRMERAKDRKRVTGYKYNNILGFESVIEEYDDGTYYVLKNGER